MANMEMSNASATLETSAVGAKTIIAFLTENSKKITDTLADPRNSINYSSCNFEDVTYATLYCSKYSALQCLSGVENLLIGDVTGA